MSGTHLITSSSTSPFLNELRWLESQGGDESAPRDSKVRWPCQIQSSASRELYQNRGSMLSFATAGRCAIILKAQLLLCYWDQEHCQFRINLQMLCWKKEEEKNQSVRIHIFCNNWKEKIHQKAKIFTTCGEESQNHPVIQVKTLELILIHFLFFWAKFSNHN